MRIRLGYVANALRLQDSTPSKTITFHHIQKIPELQSRVSRIVTIARENLRNTLRILKANLYDGIALYRFTSKLVPLATHPDFHKLKIIDELTDELSTIGKFVNEHQLRVSFHPDHFTLLNSPTPEIQAASSRDLQFHTNLLQMMAIESHSKLVIHVGGKYNDKKAALERFQQQFRDLPKDIQSLLVLENDDRCFSAAEVLELVQKIGIPMVFDMHHHQILNQGEAMTDLLPAIFASWGNHIPKLHLSSPRDQKDPRSHADYIEAETAVKLLETLSPFKLDVDIMIEAKQKDLALFKLAADLKERGYRLPTVGEIIL